MYVTNIDQKCGNVRQLVLIEECKRCVHNDIKIYVDKQKTATLDDVARLLTCKVLFATEFSFKSHDQSSIGKKTFSNQFRRPSISDSSNFHK